MSSDFPSHPDVSTSASLTALDKRLEEALQASGIGVWEWDLTTGEIRVSSAVGPLYGLDAGVGMTSVRVFLREYCHPDDRPKLDAALDLLINQDRPADLRFRALTAAGEERLLDVHARVVRDREGSPLRLVGVVHRAGYGDRRFRDLADAAPVLMWATGPDLACTFFNAAYMRFTGRRLEDELGEGWLDLVHPDDVGVVREADARAEGGRAPFEARYRLRRHDGVYRWMFDSGIPVFSPDGGFEGLTGGMVDLHDLIEREVMLDGIFAGAPVGLALFDPDLRIRRVNESYARITGTPADAHVGRRVEEVFPGIAAATTALLAQVLRTAEPATGLLVAGPAAGEDGPARRFEASFIPLVLPGGEVAGLASMLSEVTDRHEAEQRMAQLYRERVEVASTLQTALLPPELPEIDGIELAARYLPADEASEVGGDFYDVFRAKSGWGVIVGDVCGKGAKAAAATALARYTVRASFASGAPGPVEALELLDTTLIAEHDGDRFVTAVLGVLEPRDDGRVGMRMACGGHPCPIVLRADGSRELLEPEGRVVGVAIEGGWEIAELTLERGDALLLYTDGITEADRREPLFPRELAAALPEGAHRLDAHGLAEMLERIALERGGERLRDDVAVIALKVAG